MKKSSMKTKRANTWDKWNYLKASSIELLTLKNLLLKCEKELELWSIKMGADTKDFGNMASEKDLALNISKTEMSFMVTSKMENPKDKVYTYGALETDMKEDSLEAARRGLATGDLRTNTTLDSGESENLMAMEFSRSKMANFMKVSGASIQSMEEVSKLRMRLPMLAGSQKAFGMDTVSFTPQTQFTKGTTF